MDKVIQLHFWVSFFSTVALIAMPIILIGGAKPFKAFKSATIIYIGIIIMSACNFIGPF